MDTRFVDVDFQQEAEDGSYSMGALAPALFGSRQPSFEDAIQTIPRSSWESLIKGIDDSGVWTEHLITRIYNQGSEGSCVSNATSQAHEIVQARTYGKDKVVHLSAISLYKRCGRSPGSGSMVNDNLDEMVSNGVLPLDNEENRKRFKHVFPATGFYTKYPNGWEETAKLFRGVEWFDVRSLDGFITALLLGFPVVYGRAGHSICAVRPMLKSGRLVVMYANSWGAWGDKGGDFNSGFGYDSESMIRSGASWAFALRTVNLVKEQV